MPQIEIHADDYAISPHSSEDILNCLRAGKLDGVSVLTNMSCFEEYAVKLKAEYDSFPKKPRLTVHLNFMEGHCAADPAEVPHLVDENGYFNISWGTLFKWNYTPKVFLELKINDVEIRYGAFVTAVINFLIMAFVIFLLVKAINKISELGFKKKKEEEPAKPKTKICPYCKSEIPADAVKCGHCTSDLPAEELAPQTENG